MECYFGFATGFTYAKPLLPLSPGTRQSPENLIYSRGKWPERSSTSYEVLLYISATRKLIRQYIKAKFAQASNQRYLFFFQDPVSRYSYFVLSKYNLLSKAEFDVIFDQGLLPYTVSQPPSLLSSPLFPFSGLVCYRVFVISNDYPLFLLHATPGTPLLVTALLYHPVPSLGYLSYSPSCP